MEEFISERYNNRTRMDRLNANLRNTRDVANDIMSEMVSIVKEARCRDPEMWSLIEEIVTILLILFTKGA
jgi:hypothetical protein